MVKSTKAHSSKNNLPAQDPVFVMFFPGKALVPDVEADENTFCDT